MDAETLNILEDIGCLTISGPDVNKVNSLDILQEKSGLKVFLHILHFDVAHRVLVFVPVVGFRRVVAGAPFDGRVGGDDDSPGTYHIALEVDRGAQIVASREAHYHRQRRLRLGASQRHLCSHRGPNHAVPCQLQEISSCGRLGEHESSPCLSWDAAGDRGARIPSGGSVIPQLSGRESNRPFYMLGGLYFDLPKELLI